MRAAAFFLAIAALALPVRASSLDVSHIDKLGRAFDIVLGSKSAKKRVLYVLVDPSKALRDSAPAAAFSASRKRHARVLSKTEIGVWVVGAAKPVLEPTTEHAEVERHLTAGAVGANQYRDVFAAAAVVAKDLGKRRGGARSLLILSLENGDTFENLPGAITAVKRSRARVWMVAREAFLADSHPILNVVDKVPRDSTRIASDAVAVDFPWLWIGQVRAATNEAPSGYPYWPVSRFAEATKGRVFLYYPGGGAYRCTALGSICVVCGGDQIAPEYPYNRTALRILAPEFGKRRGAIAVMARDSAYRAAFQFWEEASDAGLVMGRPPLKNGKLSKRLKGVMARLGGSISLSSEISRARKLIGACSRIATRIDASVERFGSGKRTRGLAALEYTRVMIHLTRLNLMYFVAFCEEVAPRALDRKAEFASPEVRPPVPERVLGIHSTPMTLGHGVEPFFHVRLPGGERTDTALRAFHGVASGFFARYAKTPYAMALRRATIARWKILGAGKPGATAARTPGSKDDDTTTEERPDRPNSPSGSSGGSGGPTSGGG